MMKSKSFSIALLVICFLFLIFFPSPAVSKDKKVGCRRKSNSPPVTGHNKAILTLNSFEKGGDGGDPSECDGKYHSDKELIVALSTRWYKKGRRCGKYIYIFAKGKKVKARVVDECDSTTGWDAAHAGQPPCGTNIVDGSKAVWEALGVSPDIGTLPVSWIDV